MHDQVPQSILVGLPLLWNGTICVFDKLEKVGKPSPKEAEHLKPFKLATDVSKTTELEAVYEHFLGKGVDLVWNNRF